MGGRARGKKEKESEALPAGEFQATEKQAEGLSCCRCSCQAFLPSVQYLQFTVMLADLALQILINA